MNVIEIREVRVMVNMVYDIVVVTATIMERVEEVIVWVKVIYRINRMMVNMMGIFKVMEGEDSTGGTEGKNNKIRIVKIS